jgi:hypothetical protein
VQVDDSDDDSDGPLEVTNALHVSHKMP